MQALIKGEIDFVEDITAARGARALQGQPGITAHNGNSPVLRRDRLQHRLGATPTTGKPIGDPNPAVLRPEVPARARLRARPRPARPEGLPGRRRCPGTTIVPPAYTNYHWEPPADQEFTFDLDKAGQLLDAAGYKKGSDGMRTMPDGKPIGTLRLVARSDSPDVASTRWTTSRSGSATSGIDAEVTAMDSRAS